MNEHIEIFQDSGLEEIPPNYLQDFDAFTETGNTMVSFAQNAPTQIVRNIFIKSFELQKQNLNLANFANENEMQAQIAHFDQLIEAFRFMPNQMIVTTQDQMIASTENLFSRSNLDLLTQRAKYITHVKNVLKHQIGHTLGLNDLYDEDVPNITDQVPLMWYQFDEGIDNPAPYFENPLQVGHLALHALSCTYDLEALRQAQP